MLSETVNFRSKTAMAAEKETLLNATAAHQDGEACLARRPSVPISHPAPRARVRRRLC